MEAASFHDRAPLVAARGPSSPAPYALAEPAPPLAGVLKPPDGPTQLPNLAPGQRRVGLALG
eukprot:14514587-Alexandrium_andersonii.AAC.1